MKVVFTVAHTHGTHSEFLHQHRVGKNLQKLSVPSLFLSLFLCVHLAICSGGDGPFKCRSLQSKCLISNWLLLPPSKLLGGPLPLLLLAGVTSKNADSFEY